MESQTHGEPRTIKTEGDYYYLETLWDWKTWYFGPAWRKADCELGSPAYFSLHLGPLHFVFWVNL